MVQIYNRERQHNVYKISNEIDNRFYIGSCLSPITQRLQIHKYNAVRYPNRPIYKMMNEVGFNNVKIELLTVNNIQDRSAGQIHEQNKINELKPNLNCRKAKNPNGRNPDRNIADNVNNGVNHPDI
jgi:hypothetical protein